MGGGRGEEGADGEEAISSAKEDGKMCGEKKGLGGKGGQEKAEVGILAFFTSQPPTSSIPQPAPCPSLMQVISLIQLLALNTPIKTPARSPAAAGTWRLVWSQQAPNANPLQKFGSKQVECTQSMGTNEQGKGRMQGPVWHLAASVCSAECSQPDAGIIPPLRCVIPCPLILPPSTSPQTG